LKRTGKWNIMIAERIMMKILNETLNFKTGGFNDMKDITGLIAEKLGSSGLRNGLVTVFSAGSTAAVTTIEYEPGLVKDFSYLMENLAPSESEYNHDLRWGDGNGFSHVRASLVGPSLTIPFAEGKMRLGTWQQVVFIDFDNRARSRTVALQFLGE